MTRARAHGIGAVAVRNSNHFGTAAYWTRRMAEAGCVGILTTNGSPAMAPWGGTEKTVGANPWSVATPGGSHPPVVLDIANTGVARGKIYAAPNAASRSRTPGRSTRTALPPPTRTSRSHGLLAPMGGHKGYGISFMMDVLSGVLTGSGYATDVVGPYVPDQRSRCGHLVLALRIDAVIPDADVRRADRRPHRHHQGRSRCAAGVDGDLLPRRDRGPRRGRRRGSTASASPTRRSPICATSATPAASASTPAMLKTVPLMFTVLVDLTGASPTASRSSSRASTSTPAPPCATSPAACASTSTEQSDDPHRFVLYEIYADQAAFYEAHRSRAALRRLARGLRPMRRRREAT